MRLEERPCTEGDSSRSGKCPFRHGRPNHCWICSITSFPTANDSCSAVLGSNLSAVLPPCMCICVEAWAFIHCTGGWITACICKHKYASASTSKHLQAQRHDVDTCLHGQWQWFQERPSLEKPIEGRSSTNAAAATTSWRRPRHWRRPLEATHLSCPSAASNIFWAMFANHVNSSRTENVMPDVGGIVLRPANLSSRDGGCLHIPWTKIPCLTFLGEEKRSQTSTFRTGCRQVKLAKSILWHRTNKTRYLTNFLCGDPLPLHQTQPLNVVVLLLNRVVLRGGEENCLGGEKWRGRKRTRKKLSVTGTLLHTCGSREWIRTRGGWAASENVCGEWPFGGLEADIKKPTGNYRRLVRANPTHLLTWHFQASMTQRTKQSEVYWDPLCNRPDNAATSRALWKQTPRHAGSG